MAKETFKIRESSYWYKCTTGNKNIQINVFILVLVSLFLFVNCLGTYADHDDEFDNFIFSQRWLPSSCIEFEEKNSSSTNECVLPDSYQFWAVHGLWPNKNHGSMGPFFCNKSAHFRVDVLDPIEPELRQYWPNIEKGKAVNSLWRHEWLKHGTCAMKISHLNTELDYFNTSLSLRKQFDINNILVKNKITPSDSFGYHVLDVIHIVKGNFGKAPQISCITEKTTKKSYLSEIRLCFNKSLQLIDCADKTLTGRKTGFSSQLTNCPLNDLIILPYAAFPPTTKDCLIRRRREARDRYEKLLLLLQAIRFLM